MFYIIRLRHFITSIILLFSAVFAVSAENQYFLADESEIIDEIIIYGIRKSFKSSLDVKRRSDNVVERLSAEDIGRLPDLSIVDSLARLPGLTAEIDRGVGNAVSIRGLGTSLAIGLLNGRELVTADRGRGVRYSQFPAELIHGVDINKTSIASAISGGIAGTINLNTVKPLEFDDRAVAVNVRTTYNTVAAEIRDADSTGTRGSISYIDQFFDRTLGVAIGYARLDRTVGTVRSNIFPYINSFSDIDGDGMGNDEIPSGFEFLVRGGEDERDGAIAVIEWLLDEHWTINYDLFYSRVENRDDQRGYRVGGFTFGNSFSNPVVENGSIVALEGASIFDYGIKLSNVNERFTREDEFLSNGLNVVLKLENWRVSSDISYSKVDRVQQFLSLKTEVHDAGGNQLTSGLGASFDNRGSIPTFSVSANLTDPLINLPTELGIDANAISASDDILAVKFDLVRQFDSSPLSSVEFGMRYSSREKVQIIRAQYNFINSGDRSPVPAYAILPDPLGDYNGPLDRFPRGLAFDINTVISDVFGVPISPLESDDTKPLSWQVEEDVYSAYLQINYQSELIGLPLSGNLGVRVVRTEQISRGTQLVKDSSGTQTTPVKFKKYYTNILPAVNALLELNGKQQIRLAVSRAISRAPLDDLNPGFGLFSFGGASEAFGGNPDLDPIQSDQIDITFEHYFGDETAVTVTYFYKRLETYIDDSMRKLDFDIDGDGSNEVADFYQPINGKGGVVKGVELLYQQAFTFLPAPFDGLGVYVNYSYNDSDIQITKGLNVQKTGLEGFSRHTGNLTFWYAIKGFEGAISYRYRSHHTRRIDGSDDLAINDDESHLNLKAGYLFGNGFNLFFEATNLTNERYETYYQLEERRGRNEDYGRSYTLGFGFKI